MHCACISTKEAAASASKTVKCVHTTMKERQKAGGEEGGIGLAVTQLRRRLIVSLAKTKGIWNNGQIGAFM